MGPHKINNINILVKNLYYLGYKDPKSVADQLKLRGMDIDSDAKSSIKKCLQDLEDNQDQSSKK